MSKFQQIDEAKRTESLWPIGLIGLEPDALAQRFGLTFHRDERDGSTAALLLTDQGREYMLLRHFDSPVAGTEVLGPDRSTEPEGDLEEFLAALDLGLDLVTWRLTRTEALASHKDLGRVGPASGRRD